MSDYTPRLKTRYKEEILPKLREEFGHKNIPVSYTHLTLPTILLV